MIRRVAVAGVLAVAAGVVVVLLAAPAPKLLICHVPPGNPANAHSIDVSQNSVQLQSHIAHGDCLLSGTPNPPIASLFPCQDGLCPASASR